MVKRPWVRCRRHHAKTGSRSVSDITSVFDGLTLPDGACVFNPALVHVAGQVYCLFARVYNASETAKRCAPGHMDRSPFLDGWRGQSTNVLAVIRLSSRPMDAKLDAKLMGYSYIGHTNLEDGRMFKDMRGRMFVYLALPMGAHPKRAVVNTVSRVFIRCSRSADSCSVSLGFPRWLPYFGSPSVMDKNWVPWNGTAFMSFSHYGTFGPHSVFNWGSYDDPLPHTKFDAVAEDSVFTAFARRYGKLLHLAGGTPAVLEPSGSSFLAVGHLKAHPGCFHPEALPAWVDRSGPYGGRGAAMQARCDHLAASANDTTRGEVLQIAFDFRHDNGTGTHYPLDYAFFLYRFNATPPYNMTHISYGFMPYTWRTAVDHTGIVFPIGLERFGADDYIITYGDSDQVSKALLLSIRQAEAMLWPLAEIGRRLDEYTVCALPCEGEAHCAY
ncbi:hypothetical protein GPECTOR_59g689 [Gonium pectorale]|uniref:Uncharacterized protein n=1 Tax=Gonium pectorale TaxID=33097 RepID=A0A150G6W4_GONPE|nr:hypothetical protein GPECTOR_59g689 [Gonium pectorale]|eukprot:KXZ45080.1 hypothetical protein GPECTOR_59g689 [Gonium pectorale]